MKTRIKNKTQNHGFSMVEILIAIVLIGILGATLMVTSGNLSTTAKDKVKKGNAQTMNRMIASIRAAGGTVGDGAGNDVDTTSIKTIVDSLANKKPPIKVDDVEFKLDPPPTIASYKVTGAAPDKKVEAITGTSDAP